MGQVGQLGGQLAGREGGMGGEDWSHKRDGDSTVCHAAGSWTATMLLLLLLFVACTTYSIRRRVLVVVLSLPEP